MELLDDVCHMESRFGLFRNSVSFGARYVHGLCLLHHRLIKLLCSFDYRLCYGLIMLTLDHVINGLFTLP